MVVAFKTLGLKKCLEKTDKVLRQLYVVLAQSRIPGW